MAGRRRRGPRPAAAALRIATGAALSVLAVACGTPGSTASTASSGHAAGTAADGLSAPGATITETGSSLLYPLARTWAAAYHQQFPGVTVTTASTGSGKGIAAASGGKADIGASDAYLSSGDLVKNTALLNIPLAISAQTLIYNVPGLPAASHLRLNGQVLAAIYQGTITRWDDPRLRALNPKQLLPALTIVPVHRSDSSGDTFLFTSYLSTQDPNWDSAIGYGTTANWPAVAGAKAAVGSVNALHDCESTPGCVAYNGISYLAQARAGGLGEAMLANSVGAYTLPTELAIKASVASFVSITPPNETISMIDGPAAGGYPIVNYEYAVVSTRQQGAAKASAMRAFLRWVITTGNSASYLGPVGFQALPPDVQALGQEQIQEIGS